MKTDHLGWEVVWSLPLVVAVIGAQLAVVAGAGAFAATPPPTSMVYLYFPNNDTRSNLTIALTFGPTPVWGVRDLDLLDACVPGAIYGVPYPCHSGVQIAACADPGCQLMGGYRTTVNFSVGIIVQVPSRASTFLFTLLKGSNFPVGVQMSWWNGAGVPTAFTPLSVALVWTAGAAVCVSAVAWVTGKRSGVRWVREFAYV